jgi:hypothetical protein
MGVIPRAVCACACACVCVCACACELDAAKDYPTPPVFNHRTWIGHASAPTASASASASDESNAANAGAPDSSRSAHSATAEDAAQPSASDEAAAQGAEVQGLKFTPAIDSVDVWTMIEDAEGLFDFDVSAEPIVHVLTAKTYLNP